MKDKIINLLSLLCGSALLVWLDQYTKHLAVAKLKGQEPFAVVPGVFELLYSENRGAAFGMLQGRQGFFFVVGILVLAAAVYVMVRMPSYGCSRYHFLKVCTVMITAGAVGNMVDRVSQGYVVDFLYFKLIDFPIFNVADCYVTVGTALLFVLFMWFYRDEELEMLFPHRKERS